MSKQRRQFSPEEKYSILQEAEREGHTQTCRKYNLASSVLAYWKNKYLARGKDLGLTDTEKAFYDALRQNKSAQALMGDVKLLVIAKELVARVNRSTTIDWTIRQSAKDRVKLEVKRVLRFHKYPPDDEPRATETVLEQAELHAAELV